MVAGPFAHCVRDCRDDRDCPRTSDTSALSSTICQQSAGRFAVRADGGNQFIVPLDFARPRLRIVLHSSHSTVPAADRKTGHARSPVHHWGQTAVVLVSLSWFFSLSGQMQISFRADARARLGDMPSKSEVRFLHGSTYTVLLFEWLLPPRLCKSRISTVYCSTS